MTDKQKASKTYSYYKSLYLGRKRNPIVKLSLFKNLDLDKAKFSLSIMAEFLKSKNLFALSS